MPQLSNYFLLLVAVSAVSSANSVECVPPVALRAKLQANPQSDTYAQAGLWYTNHRKFGCAVEAYRAALEQEPKSPELLYLLGLNLIRNGEVSGAFEPLRQSIELNPSVLKPHLLLATALEQLNRAGEARSEWASALKIDPHSEIALDGASKNFLAANEFDSAVALLGPNPEGETLTLDLAAAYQGIGNTDEAIKLLRKALVKQPSSRGLNDALVKTLATQGRYQEALQIAAKSAQAHPHDLEAQELNLHLLILADDEKLARPLARKLLAAAPRDFGVLYLNGILENKSGDYGNARSYLEKAVALNPSHYDAHYNLGLALANLNDPKAARQQFEMALALGAQDPGVRFEYMKVLRTLGETDLAQAQFKRYEEEQKAKADRTLAASKMAQGDEELDKGDPKKAAQLYRDAVAAFPNYALLEYKLSAALDRTGDVDGEREALQKAVHLDPRMAIAHRQLGFLAFNDGDFATAEAHFRQAVEAAPTFADAWVSLAATLASESRPEEAKEAVKHALEVDPQNANAVALQKELLRTVKQAHP
jgi:Flp pilus assembly protein TadD